MTIGKKSIAVILVIVLFLLGLDLAVKRFVDLASVKTRITAELTARLDAEVAIERIGLDVLPRPELEVHGLRLVFADGTVLGVPLAGLAPSLRGLLAGRPEIVRISLEAPDIRLAPLQREPEADNQTAEAHYAELVLRAQSSLKTIPPCTITVSDGTLHMSAPDGSPLVLENISAKAGVTPQEVRISADCASSLWKALSVTLSYHDPEAVLELDARDVDIVQGIRSLKAFAGAAFPDVATTKNLRGIIDSVSLTATLPNVSDPLTTAVISGRGSFEDMSLSLPDLGLEVHDLEGAFELDNGTLAATGISARLGKSRIQEAAIHLDRARGFKPSRISAEFNLDLSEVPGLLHVIPDPDVRGEIALIKDPQGTAVGTFELRAERDSYSTEIAVKKLLLQSTYRAFPPALELSRGICTYRAGLLAFNGFSGKLGASILPDFSLSFSLRDDEQFSAAARGATIAPGDLRMVLSSFDSSRKLIETITEAGGRLQIQNLSLKGPLTEPESWTIAVDAQLDDVSVTAAGLDGPVAVRSGMLKADRKACTLSQAEITYLDAELAGSLRLDGYFDGIRKAAADVRGSLGENALKRVSVWCDMPAALALRAPVKIGKSRFAWTRGGATTVVGDFVLVGSKAGLNLRVDDKAIEIKELRIRDAASQCRFGMKIEEDSVAVTYAGMLKKETLDRVLQENPFLQGWIQGDFSATFNQKKPRSSSATGTLSWEKAGYPAVDALPVNISSAVITARDSTLVFDSAHLSAGQDSAGMHGSVSFADEAFTLAMNISADSIDLDAFKDLLATDNASSHGSADEFWETPLRGTLKLTSREIKKNSFTCAPFNARFSFGDKAVTIKAVDTKLCGIDVPAEVRITPDGITLQAQPRAMQGSLQEVFQCLTGAQSIMTGSVDIEGSVRSQGKPAALLDGLGGNFLITARDGRIYKSGVLLKILSFLSIQNLLSGDMGDMAKKGYAYQSLHVTAAVAGQTVQVQKAILISSSLTLVCKGTINIENRQFDLEVLATPFQIQNQLLSKVPLVGGWLSKPVLGVPLKITGTFDDPKISVRTSSAMTRGLMDIAKGIIQAPIKIIDPVLPKKPSEPQ